MMSQKCTDLCYNCSEPFRRFKKLVALTVSLVVLLNIAAVSLPISGNALAAGSSSSFAASDGSAPALLESDLQKPWKNMFGALYDPEMFSTPSDAANELPMPEMGSPTSVSAKDNVLMSDEIVLYNVETMYVLGNKSLTRQQISSIKFLSELPGDIQSKLSAKKAWDVSAAKNGKVYAWIGDKDKNGLFPLYIGAKGGVIAPGNCSSLFGGYVSASSIDFNNSFDTSSVWCMSSMFNSCLSLSSLDLSGFNTSNVIDMTMMFYQCIYLQKLNVSSFDTRKVMDMYGMFSACASLSTLNLNNFNTSNVLNMGFMFDQCVSLRKLDLSRFNTAGLTDLIAMFQACSALEELNISSFDTSKVTDISYMFTGCTALKELDLNGFDTRHVTTAYAMFYSCSALKKLIAPENFVSNKSIDTDYMYDKCGVSKPTHTVSHTALASGSKGNAVKTLQQQLIRLGYLSGSADGSFGSTTETAVKAYQKSCSLQQTGKADLALQLKLIRQ